MKIAENEIVLFQGDSVTDVRRDRTNPNDMGNGYPMMVASWFAASFPEKNVTFINRGIGGNRVKDLRARWEEDCIQLQPTLLSILIGVNDCWRRYDKNDPTSVEKFEEDYRFILDQAKERTNAKIVLCEPFILPVPEDRKEWRVDLDPKINVVRNLAREYQTLLIPLDGIISSAAASKEPTFWLRDGVHPTPAGHALIAREWMRRMECL
jgi:lysophospholipase L1-like esterase